MTVPRPAEETERLEALRRYRILDTPPESCFDRIAEIASAALSAPFAMVTLVDAERNWFKARKEWPLAEVERDLSFCGWAILSQEVMCVEDALRDPRFTANPLVQAAPRVRFYSGAPLITREGLRLGTVCIFDTEPRPALGPQQARLLEQLAGVVMDELELRRNIAELPAGGQPSPTIYEGAPAGIAIIDREGSISHANNAWARLCGWPQEELPGRPLRTLLPQEDREAVAGFEHALSEEAESGAEFRIRQKTGDELDVLMISRPLEDEGLGAYRIAALVDVTRLRRLERYRRQAHKMEAIGRLAGGIAHRCNNLLTIISGYSQILQSQLESNSSLSAYAEEIFRAGQRMAAVTSHLLAFSRRRFTQPKLLDLNALIADLLEPLRRAAGAAIEVLSIPAHALEQVHADPSEIEQALRNLIVNAREAMPGGGRITIETGNLALASDFSPAHPDAPAGRYVLLTVTDTGEGMSPETLSHAFEPFFTTKGLGKGTGLATVYGIVRQCGGYVSLSSEAGRGTTVRLYLPTAEAQGAGPQAARRGFRTGTEVILLVNDDPGVRGAIRQVLMRHGYTVLDAEDGRAAVELSDRYGGPIHLVVVNILMPDLTGPELIEKLSVRRPALKVLYVSAYVEDTTLQDSLLRSGAILLRKPFTLETLSEQLRELLDRPPVEG